MKPNFLWMILFSFLLTGLSSSADAQKVDFNTQIKPLLEKHCMECHREDGKSYPIDVKEDAFQYIVEEDPEDSEMYMVMKSEDEDELMPPADFGRPMTKDEIELVRTWIEEGADWPDDAEFVLWEPDQASDAESKDSPPKQNDDAHVADPIEAEKAPVDESDKEADPAVDPRVYKAVGSLHPAILHLPMGLLLAAGLFALLSLRGNFVMSDCAYYCLWLGVIGAVFACVSGWYYSDMEHKGAVTEFSDLFKMNQKIFWHRSAALISTIFGLLVALYAMSARAKDPDEGATWKLGAIILAAGIGYVGMTGGKVQYGPNHYKDLNSLWTEMVGDIGGNAAPAEDADATDDASKDGEAKEGEAKEGGEANKDQSVDGDSENDEPETDDETSSPRQMSNTI